MVIGSGLTDGTRQTVPHCVACRLSPVGASGLGENVADMRRHCIEADRQHQSDVGIAATDCEQPQHLDLAQRQIIVCVG